MAVIRKVLGGTKYDSPAKRIFVQVAWDKEGDSTPDNIKVQVIDSLREVLSSHNLVLLDRAKEYDHALYISGYHKRNGQRKVAFCLGDAGKTLEDITAISVRGRDHLFMEDKAIHKGVEAVIPTLAKRIEERI